MRMQLTCELEEIISKPDGRQGIQYGCHREAETWRATAHAKRGGGGGWERDRWGFDTCAHTTAREDVQTVARPGHGADSAPRLERTPCGKVCMREVY